MQHHQQQQQEPHANPQLLTGLATWLLFFVDVVLVVLLVLVSVCVFCFSTFCFLLSALFCFSPSINIIKNILTTRSRSGRRRSQQTQWPARQAEAGENSKFKIQAPLQGAGRTIIEMDSIRLQPPLGSCQGRVAVRREGGVKRRIAQYHSQDQFCIFGLCKHDVCHVTCSV